MGNPRPKARGVHGLLVLKLMGIAPGSDAFPISLLELDVNGPNGRKHAAHIAGCVSVERWSMKCMSSCLMKLNCLTKLPKGIA